MDDTIQLSYQLGMGHFELLVTAFVWCGQGCVLRDLKGERVEGAWLFPSQLWHLQHHGVSTTTLDSRSQFHTKAIHILSPWQGHQAGNPFPQAALPQQLFFPSWKLIQTFILFFP